MTIFKHFLRLCWHRKWIIFLFIGMILIFVKLATLDTAVLSSEKIALLPKPGADPAIVENLKEYLASEGYGFYDLEANDTSIEELLDINEITAAITIDSEIGQKLQSGQTVFRVQAPDNNMNTEKIQAKLNAYAMISSAVLNDSENKFTPSTAKQIKQALALKAEVRNLGQSPELRLATEINFFKAFLPYVMNLCLMSLLAYAIFDLEDPRLKRRCLLGAVSRTQWNLGVFSGQLVITTIMLALIFAFSLPQLSADPLHSLKIFVPSSIVFCFTTCCLTNLLCKLVPNKLLYGAALTYTMGTSFISGATFPQELLSKGVLAVARFFPTYYFVEDMELANSTFSERLPYTLVVLAFGIFFLVLSILVDRLKSRSKSLSEDRLRVNA